MSAPTPTPGQKLLPLQEAKAGGKAAIKEQIELRRELQSKMVGRLYPEILECEIMELIEASWAIDGRDWWVIDP